MKQHSAHPDIKIWRLPDVDHVEFIRAAAMTRPTPKQVHQEFVIGVVEQGVHTMYYRRTYTTASRGHLLLAQPGEIIACDPSGDGGYTFRALHGIPDLLQQTAGEITGRKTEMPFFSKPIVPNTYLYTRFLSFHQRLERPASRLERSSLLQDMLALIIIRCTAERLTLPSLGQERGPVRQVREYLEEARPVIFGETFSLIDNHHQQITSL